ncbi:uncharacterized protein A1O9_01218 [Exophiala aquamarina CBS 119918]|uniref:Uncharacterized protein n=1 Tax=Exophiala aquamarina CBS 119918 TaxID=1182545 RepID=A0A072PTR5_9EURO|nr:uncharacterized protein A1O9_01218 [Exophiala aquamarina CBS 119918]KEF63241.1 hypothetical protein A1O9_01218 [Exophiala aquamarina CBS 119918]
MSCSYRQSNLHCPGALSNRLDVSRIESELIELTRTNFDAYRWGCPPGWLCKPTRENCNFEPGIPDRNFLCPPDQCIPAEALPVPLATWDATIYGNSTPALNPGLSVQALDDYFNINPAEFGLSYEIFVVDETITLTSTTVRPPSPTVGARQAQTSIPGTCFPWCNNCLLEAQANGKTPALCVPGSAFGTSLEQCEQCIQVHGTDDSGTFVQIAPQFQQFLDYCDQFSTVIVTTSITATTTNSAGSTSSSISSLLSTTVTPRTSSSTAPNPTGPQTSTSAVVAPTVTSVISTSYSESTVMGNAWSSATIILPLENNSTTTIYGSELTSGATLVLPIAQTTNSYTTTLSGSTAAAGASSSSTAAGSGSPSQFSGGASRDKSFISEDLRWWTLVLGMVIPLWLGVGL